MKILIITGGRIDFDFASDLISREKFDHIIVVDGALAFWDRYVEEKDHQARFDHLVGDFDTISPDILEKYIHREDISVHRFNPVKDNTDTDIAIRLTGELSEGCSDAETVIIGATGTRADHLLANLQLLEVLRRKGIKGVIADSHNRIRLLEKHTVLKKDGQFGFYLSLIPISEKLSGLTMKGFKYEVEDVEVIRGDSLCVSNEIYAGEAVIDLKEGDAYLIESRD